MTRYPYKTRLQHHAGSVWEVMGSRSDGDYVIVCIAGTVRPGWIGGEVAGTTKTAHADYLHGDGWTRLYGSEARGWQRQMDAANPPVIEQD